MRNKASRGGALYTRTWHTADGLVVYGSLIAQNTTLGTNATLRGGAGLFCLTERTEQYVANCTIAHNDSDYPGDPGIVYTGSYGSGRPVRMVNTILSSNNNGVKLNDITGNRAYFQRCTLNEPLYAQGSLTSSDYGDPHTVTGALGFVDSHFHSVDDNNNAHQTVQSDLEGPVPFSAAGTNPYMPTGSSRSIDSGLMRLNGSHTDINGSFTYVDCNMDGDYDRAVDVIVRFSGCSFKPEGSGVYPRAHFVYESDLAGGKRIVSWNIDRGAFELPARGTVVLFR
jgi:hypothetical protein